jgi:hypothetical protein
MMAWREILREIKLHAPAICRLYGPSVHELVLELGRRSDI